MGFEADKRSTLPIRCRKCEHPQKQQQHRRLMLRETVGDAAADGKAKAFPYVCARIVLLPFPPPFSALGRTVGNWTGCKVAIRVCTGALVLEHGISVRFGMELL